MSGEGFFYTYEVATLILWFLVYMWMAFAVTLEIICGRKYIDKLFFMKGFSALFFSTHIYFLVDLQCQCLSI